MRPTVHSKDAFQEQQKFPQHAFHDEVIKATDPADGSISSRIWALEEACASRNQVDARLEELSMKLEEESARRLSAEAHTLSTLVTLEAKVADILFDFDVRTKEISKMISDVDMETASRILRSANLRQLLTDHQAEECESEDFQLKTEWIKENINKNKSELQSNLRTNRLCTSPRTCSQASFDIGGSLSASSVFSSISCANTPSSCRTMPHMTSVCSIDMEDIASSKKMYDDSSSTSWTRATRRIGEETHEDNCSELEGSLFDGQTFMTEDSAQSHKMPATHIWNRLQKLEIVVTDLATRIRDRETQMQDTKNHMTRLQDYAENDGPSQDALIQELNERIQRVGASNLEQHRRTEKLEEVLGTLKDQVEQMVEKSRTAEGCPKTTPMGARLDDEIAQRELLCSNMNAAFEDFLSALDMLHQTITRERERRSEIEDNVDKRIDSLSQQLLQARHDVEEIIDHAQKEQVTLSARLAELCAATETLKEVGVKNVAKTGMEEELTRKIDEMLSVPMSQVLKLLTENRQELSTKIDKHAKHTNTCFEHVNARLETYASDLEELRHLMRVPITEGCCCGKVDDGTPRSVVSSCPCSSFMSSVSSTKASSSLNHSLRGGNSEDFSNSAEFKKDTEEQMPKQTTNDDKEDRSESDFLPRIEKKVSSFTCAESFLTLNTNPRMPVQALVRMLNDASCQPNKPPLKMGEVQAFGNVHHKVASIQSSLSTFDARLHRPLLGQS